MGQRFAQICPTSRLHPHNAIFGLSYAAVIFGLSPAYEPRSKKAFTTFSLCFSTELAILVANFEK